MLPSDALRALIVQKGAINLADYMSLCLGHPEHGYYNTRDPLGAAGDFITAPEISQVFGELIGVWCAHMWQVMDRPAHIHLVELGPGRGTLMNDLMRAACKLPGFRDAADIHLVEMSPSLTALQQQAMQRANIKAHWHRWLSDVPQGPLILVANEFFDALPVHQFVKTSDGWRERQIADADGVLEWHLFPAPPPDGTIPGTLADAEDGAIFERAPLREQLAGEIAHRLATHPGAALIIDYGFSGPAAGDTFQALKAHRFTDPLAEPGAADLTSHVDFAALVAAADRAGCPAYDPITQAQLLDGLGIGLRMDALKRARPDKAGYFDLAMARLVSPDEMGALFKAIALSSIGMPPPFEPD